MQIGDTIKIHERDNGTLPNYLRGRYGKIHQIFSETVEVEIQGIKHYPIVFMDEFDLVESNENSSNLA